MPIHVRNGLTLPEGSLPTCIQRVCVLHVYSFASCPSPHMWLADGDSLMCYIVRMLRLIAQMFYLFSLWGFRLVLLNLCTSKLHARMFISNMPSKVVSKVYVYYNLVHYPRRHFWDQGPKKCLLGCYNLKYNSFLGLMSKATMSEVQILLQHPTQNFNFRRD